MRYRTLGRTGLQTGEIGMGCEGFLEKSDDQVREMVDLHRPLRAQSGFPVPPWPGPSGAAGEVHPPGPPLRRLEGGAVQAHKGCCRSTGGI